MKITVGIKALNEKSHIAAAIESALAGVAPWHGEVVLADSGSTDGTIEIAQQYPIRIVQLQNWRERSCGAGAQLAFQHATGDYFYILDGDMKINAAFLAEAVSYLDVNPHVAGIGGRVSERDLTNLEFQIRHERLEADTHRQSGEVDRLDQGGLYRRSAVREVGYFADRNLYSFEEYELGARLRAAGWLLVRLPIEAVEHYGHQDDAYRLLWKRLKSGYAWGCGQVVRAALGHKHLPIIVFQFEKVRQTCIVLCWWVTVFALLALITRPWTFFALCIFIVVPIAYLSLRRRSITAGLYSFVSWNVTAIGFVVGLFNRRQPATKPLLSTILKD